MEKFYLCIDLKSFFASVECVERGLDPMTTDLVVADPERTDKTICLAVSPSLRAKGVKNRSRVFEIPKNLEYITAPPRMQKYIDYAAEIYAVYLSYVSPDDIHVYSIDEAFLDVTSYLPLYKMTVKALAIRIMDDIYKKVGVRATCGIGTNMYLAKIALDILAKHSPDFIASLDEENYRRLLWDHTPLTDFWRIGPGTARRLQKLGAYTMRSVAHLPEESLYSAFGVDAELLIDHAWGREPTTIKDIKAYKAKTNCLTSGQVLMRDYSFDEARLIVKEMTDSLTLDMVDRALVASSATLYIGYSNSSGVEMSKGTARFEHPTSSDLVIMPSIVSLYNRIAKKGVGIHRINVCFNNVLSESVDIQTSLFDDYESDVKGRKIQETVVSIKHRHGKNSILRGINLEEASTAKARAGQIGGHKSGEKA